MLNHYAMQHEVVEAARDLTYNAAHHGDTSGLIAYNRKLSDSARRFSDDELKILTEIGEHVARLQTSKVTYDRTADGETESICDNVAAEEDWLLAQSESFSKRSPDR